MFPYCNPGKKNIHRARGVARPLPYPGQRPRRQPAPSLPKGASLDTRLAPLLGMRIEWDWRRYSG